MSYPTPVPNAAVTFAPYREMTRAVRPIRARECAICLGPHEEEIHSATVRVRRWFRSEVMKGFPRRPVC